MRKKNASKGLESGARGESVREEKGGDVAGRVVAPGQEGANGGDAPRHGEAPARDPVIALGEEGMGSGDGAEPCAGREDGPERVPGVFSMRRVYIKEEHLLADLREFGETVGGRPFKIKEYAAWPERQYSPTTMMHRFGKWSRALERAGIQGGRCREYTPEQLIEHLAKVWKEMGRPPGVRTLKRKGWVGCGPYMRHWGSLRKAVVQLARYHRGEIPWETVLRGGKGVIQRCLQQKIRWAVLERDGRRCRVCGKGPEDGAKMEVDHIVPVSAGGGDEMENLRVLCRDCNRGKGGRRKKRGA